jgi:hypothetical protein
MTIEGGEGSTGVRWTPLSAVSMKAQKAMSISIPPSRSAAEIQAAIAGLREPHDVVHVMAGSAEFLTPRETCGLRALIDHAASLVDEVVFHCPVNQDVHGYLGRVNFYENLAENVRLTRRPPQQRRWDRRDQLIEVVRVRTADDVEALADRVWDVAKAHCGSGRTAKAFATAIAAATENVIDHARSPIGALIAAQRYANRGLELAVVDLGLGIPATLRANRVYTCLTDLGAVERALEDGVSSVPDDGRGAGLAELVHGVARAGDATLRVSSGQAELTLGWTSRRQRPNRAALHPAAPGTWISVRLDP